MMEREFVLVSSLSKDTNLIMRAHLHDVILKVQAPKSITRGLRASTRILEGKDGGDTNIQSIASTQS